MMNKKGTMMLVLLIAVIYFMAGMILYQFLKPDVLSTRTSLECSNPDTSGDMLTCLIVDGVVPMAIIGILSVAGGYVTEKSVG